MAEPRLSTTFSWLPKPADRKLVQQQTAAEVKRLGLLGACQHRDVRWARRRDIADNLKTLGITVSQLDSAAKIEAPFAANPSHVALP